MRNLHLNITIFSNFSKKLIFTMEKWWTTFNYSLVSTKVGKSGTKLRDYLDQNFAVISNLLLDQFETIRIKSYPVFPTKKIPKKLKSPSIL